MGSPAPSHTVQADVCADVAFGNILIKIDYISKRADSSPSLLPSLQLRLFHAWCCKAPHTSVACAPPTHMHIGPASFL